ncbi:MAG: hypothetical protein C6P35_00745 [Cohnella sp.]|uniref:hypothetical protein n=1 Tax=Cohnella sp. TaxID=1883426 RepID=UPI000E3A111C|nr:hypothetical protein [Cohnella sp.]REK68637.1 MAG: hypothetical protein C6P35_00745 [Cohnella sp.]
MGYSKLDIKKILAEHYVYDAWQFLQNAYKNIGTAEFCFFMIKNWIEKMNKEHLDWYNGMIKELQENKSFSVSFDSLPKFTVSINGIESSYSFLIDKYIKDFFQYTRNSLDSVAQFINSSLLANKSLNIERVDFNKIVSFFEDNNLKNIFCKTFCQLKSMQVSDELNYISEFNNRVKHISDAPLTMSYSLLSTDSVNKIGAFYKKRSQFEAKDIIEITSNILNFIKNEYQTLIDVVLDEVKYDKYVVGRMHSLRFHVQMNNSDPSQNLTVIYVDVNESMDELPDIIRILFVKKNEDDIEAYNCDYGDILVRDSKRNFLGRYKLDEEIVEDNLLRYRVYKKDNVDGTLAFVEHVQKKYPFKPMLMSGQIVNYTS